MQEILSDLSPAAIARAMEANNEAFYTFWHRSPAVRGCARDGLTWFESGYRASFMNTIWRAELTPETADADLIDRRIASPTADSMAPMLVALPSSITARTCSRKALTRHSSTSVLQWLIGALLGLVFSIPHSEEVPLFCQLPDNLCAHPQQEYYLTNRPVGTTMMINIPTGRFLCCGAGRFDWEARK
jgi:hypothetical protein